MASAYMTLKNRQVSIEVENDGPKQAFSVSLEGAEKARDFIVEHGIGTVSCSSTIDFPHEYGVAKSKMSAWKRAVFAGAEFS